MQALVGTRTAADINLAAQLLILAGLLIGFALARRQRFDRHANVQTTMVLLNLLFILTVMSTSFYSYVIAGGTTEGRVAQWMIVHALAGLIVEGFAIYLILRMRTGLIPTRFRIGNIKLAMRATLTAWTLLVLLGVGIYVERYLIEREVATAPLDELHQLGADLYVHAVELDDAVDRQSVPAVKRHAEHLINLIEGEQGIHYGDNDIDGHMEDPGDGVGLLARLDEVRAATDDPAVATRAADVEQQLAQIIDRSVEVLGVADAAQAEAAVAEVLTLSRQANAEGVLQIGLGARAAGVAQAPTLTVAASPSGEAGSREVGVREIDFAFLPETLTVPAGTTVVWVNDEAPKHTATADDELFDSGDQNLGDRYAYTFTEPGAYPYFCRYHGDVDGVGMAGVIVVEGPG